MSDGSLQSLCLMPPSFDSGRRGVSVAACSYALNRRVGSPIQLSSRLFVDDAPWHWWSPLVARITARVLQQHGVLVSHLASELGPLEPNESDDDPTAEPKANPGPVNETSPGKILPYRNERYGLSADDFDDSVVIDLRLSPMRAASGRFAYGADQIGRWESTPEGQPLAGGGWVAGFSFPPDVEDLRGLAAKIDQLRSLAPNAAVILSVTPEWLRENRPGFLACGADALLVRASQVCMQPLHLAAFVRQIAAMETDREIWLAPPRWSMDEAASVDDCVKLIALGASAIAIDHWLKDAFEEIREIPQPSVYAGDPRSQIETAVAAILDEHLAPSVERFNALLTTLVDGNSLGTFSGTVAKSLGIRHITAR